jgi:ABC-2 type transport system permease protein
MSASTLSLSTVVRSELVKLRSQRSYLWLLLGVVAFTAVLGPFEAIGVVVAASGGEGAASLDDLLSLALSGLSTACILGGIAGVLAVTVEYPTRAIRTTFTAVPRRGLVVAAKALATALVLGTAVLLASGTAVVATRVVLATAEVHLPLGVTTLRVVLGSAMYVVTWAWLGQALAWLVRSAVGATMSLIAVMFMVPALVGLLPRVAAAAVVPHLPSQASAALLVVQRDATISAPAVALAVLVAELVVGLALALAHVARRDA